MAAVEVETMRCPHPVDEGTDITECPALSKEPIVSVSEIKDKKETIDYSKLEEIPSPPRQSYWGLLGHAPDLNPTLPVQSYWEIMEKHGPIYKLDLGMSYPRVFVGTAALVNEMAEDNRFIKFTHKLHREMRPVFGDGLFSAESTSKAWGKAHRLLAPALGPIGLRKMFDDMQDLSAQMILKWDRFGPEQEIECIDDMARLAFDTVGLCAFGYRFNEFYMAEFHPFMIQLKEAIVESGKRSNRPDLVNKFYYKEEALRQENIVEIRKLCREIIQDRIRNPMPDARDLLNLMLDGIERETGEKLGIENVEYQIPTFLGAGYETTSATLAFIYYFLVENPRVLAKAQQEVDEVVGSNVFAFDMIPKLKYIGACIKESLRLQHPVSLLTRFATRDTVVGGRWLIKEGQMISGIWHHFHRDPSIWGSDSDEFKPERMLEANFSKLPPNAYKPFGDGLRACIGHGFADQEMIINIAMVLQKFNISKVDPNYKLQLRGQMALKPIGFKIRAKRRPGKGLMTGIPGGGAYQQQEQARMRSSQQETAWDKPQVMKPVSVFYGGQMGTSESLVYEFQRLAREFGIDIIDTKALDAAIDNLPTDRPSLIITPSYDGRPPDNAKKFVAWIEGLAAKGQHLPAGTKYAIFGLGNSDWNNTFHKVPKLVDETLETLGAKRIIETGFANVKQDVTGSWEAWSEDLCAVLAGAYTSGLAEKAGVEVHIESSKLDTLPQALGGEQMFVGVVASNVELADTTIGAAKRHVEVRLPAGTEYTAGDYLVVQGRNPDESVHRVIRRFDLSPEHVMSVSSSKKDYLPSQPMAVEHFLRSSVELAAPITKRQLATLALWAEEGSAAKTQLDTMHGDVTYQKLLDRRFSVIDVLEEVAMLRIPFGVYIDLLPPLVPRVYSISSSPLAPENSIKGSRIVAVTFDIFEAPAMSGHGTFHGVASSYLATRKPGDNISCLIRAPTGSFRLPHDTETPIVMFAAGTGIAPMRGFIQERAVLQRAGHKLGPAILFFGCRNADNDFVYRSELAQWEKEGVVEVVPCFSKPGGSQKGQHVDDVMYEHRERLWEMFNNGAKFYTCGSAGRLGRSSAEMWRRIYMEKTGKSEVNAHDWLDQIKKDRYLSDVY